MRIKTPPLEKTSKGGVSLKKIVAYLPGFIAGAVNGLFGAGGGMVLVPLLSRYSQLQEDQIFPSSVAIILPICLVSLFMGQTAIPWSTTYPYLLGSVIGGVAAGFGGKKIPVLWLHRGLGVLILWGGIRYLC